ncbi:MFS transporter [Halostagnicola kamekurae]|uniref:Major Facilitator Superfamily protein n=1 Tax=Halostagnicola kamekurae TaxID=619731 RepID=A0A1I6NX50_9EURY|nr:MFS transporter [Halostagnicola kamekurae]SFS32470.1 Major Facilitator Superfamily protein [Halostagnicola kamekurae]
MEESDTLKSDPKLYAILGLAGAGVLASTLVSPALPGVASKFDLTEARVGMVMTAFFLTAVVAIPIVGIVTDVWGRRRVFLGSLLVYGAAGTLIGFVDTFAVVLLLRAVQGCAFPGLLPMAITLIGDHYDGAVATTAQGYLTSITGFGGIVSPLAAGVLVDISWRLPFWLYGISFVAFVLCYWWLPEPTASHTDQKSTALESTAGPNPTPGANRPAVPNPAPERSEPATPGSTPDHEQVREPGDANAGGNTSVLTARVSAWIARLSEMVREVEDALTSEARTVIAAVIALFFVRYALFTFMPLYAVTVLGASEFIGGVAVAVLGLGRFVAAPYAGRLATWISRPTVLVSSLLCFGAGTWALLLTTDPWAVIVILGLTSVGDGLFDPIANDIVTMSAPAAVRGRIVSVLEVGKTGAIAVSPAAFGLLLSASSYTILFLTGGALMAATAGTVGFVLFDD